MTNILDVPTVEQLHDMRKRIMLSELAPDSMRLPKRGSVVEFAEQYHYRSGKDQPLPGLYSTDMFPHQAGILERFGDAGTEWLVIVAAIQVAKSTCMEIGMQYSVERDPGPMAWLLPTEKSRNKFMDERLAPLIMASPSWRAKLSGGRSSITQEGASFKQMNFYALIPTKDQLAQNTYRYFFIDELDKMPKVIKGEGDTLKQAQKRTSNFPGNRKIVYASSPRTAPSSIVELYNATDQGVWLPQCQRCGTHHPWTWEAFIKEPERGQSWQELRHAIDTGQIEAAYTCPVCGEVNTDGDKDAMNKGGKWHLQNPEVKLRAGFHLPSLVSPFKSFAFLWAEYCEAMEEKEKTGLDDKLETFWNQERGEPFVPEESKIEESAIEKRINYNLPRRTVPHTADRLLCAIDVQKHCCYAGIGSFRRSPCQLHVVDWIKTDGPSLDLLNDWIFGRNFILDQGDRVGRVSLVGVDAADGNRMAEIYKWVNKHVAKSRNVFATRGNSTGLGGGRFATKSKQEDAEHGGRLLLTDAINCKEFFANMFSKDPEGIEGISFPPEVVEDPMFMTQFMNQTRVVELNKKTNQTRVYYKKDGPDHIYDVYRNIMIAIAAYGGLIAGKEPTKRYGPKYQIVKKSYSG